VTEWLENVLLRIRRFEGWSPKPYTDSTGHLTIGYGTNIERISTKEGKLLLVARITDILRYDIPNLPEYEGLSDNRKAVYLDMLYNLGLKKFKGFKKMRHAVINERWGEAADQILDSLYAEQVGKEKGQRAYENARLMRQG